METIVAGTMTRHFRNNVRDLKDGVYKALVTSHQYHEETSTKTKKPLFYFETSFKLEDGRFWKYRQFGTEAEDGGIDFFDLEEFEPGVLYDVTIAHRQQTSGIEIVEYPYVVKKARHED